MIFHVCSSLTGRINGTLPVVSTWDITEPLAEASTGTVSVPLPSGYTARARLRELLQPRVASVVIEDDDGSLIFGGPIPRRPARTADGRVVIPVTDWRAWFYKAPLRPTTGGARRDYIKPKTALREQGLIMTDLAALALEGTGRPAMVIDDAPDTGIDRQMTTKMFQRSIGEALDDVQGRERGCEWYTYLTKTPDQTVLLAHFAAVWPERRLREVPLLLAAIDGEGGTVATHEWPEGQEAPTKVWAVDGTEDVQLWQSATSPRIAQGLELLWEQVENLNEGAGTVTKAYAFETAYGILTRASRLSGTADFVVSADRVPFGSVSVGDRARVSVDDGWSSADLAAARIVTRRMSGGAGQPGQQVLTVDLADIRYPDDGSTPGVAA